MAIAHYGMDQKVRYINIKGSKQKASDENDSQHSDKKVDEAVERWMTEAEQKTIKLVNNNWELIEHLSTLLLDKEIMYEDDLRDIENI